MQRDPLAGYARDFITQMEGMLAAVLDRGVRVVANAGGVNPRGCADALLAEWRAARRPRETPRGCRVGRRPAPARRCELIAAGHAMAHMETGVPLASVRDRVLSANAYVGAPPIIEALARGANVVVTGRCTDTALILAPLMHEFGWPANDWNRLASGIVAGHIVECGAQSTGGNCAYDWSANPRTSRTSASRSSRCRRMARSWSRSTRARAVVSMCTA